MGVLAVWMQFFACIAVVGVAGVYLTRYGDVIADKTGLGGSWIGLVLIATVTSLPELASGLSAVTLVGMPDLAVGNVLGACVLNLSILALLDILHRDQSIYGVVSSSHILAAVFGLLMIGLVGFAILSAGESAIRFKWHIGFSTPLLMAGYFMAIRSVYRFECSHVAEFTEAEPDRYPHLSLGSIVVRYALASAAVIAAGTWLPFVGASIARQMNWSEGFVGTLFIALVTTLPELVVTLSALRIGAVDMAVGNLVGSNLFNLLVLAVDDLFYLPGSLLASASSAHAVTAFALVMMSSVVIISLFYRPKSRLFGIAGWSSFLLIAIALANGYLVYLKG